MTISAAAVRILCRLPPNRTTIIAPTTNASQPPREPVAISGIMATLSPAAARNLSDRRTFARSTDRASVIIIARYGAASLGEARLPQIRPLPRKSSRTLSPQEVVANLEPPERKAPHPAARLTKHE